MTNPSLLMPDSIEESEELTSKQSEIKVTSNNQTITNHTALFIRNNAREFYKLKMRRKVFDNLVLFTFYSKDKKALVRKLMQFQQNWLRKRGL